MTTKCEECGMDKDGAGRFCVVCFARRHSPCPECSRLNCHGKSVRNATGRKYNREWVVCPRCKGERWIIY